MNQVYITGTGSFLPNAPVDNDHIEEVLGMVGTAPSRLRHRILKSNGIKTRHYALDTLQHTTHQNVDLASHACQACLDHAGLDAQQVPMLAVASTQGDLPLPGLASLLQAALRIPPCEILTTHGVCSAGMQALKSAWQTVVLGQHDRALVCASELASRLLKRSRYEAAQAALDFEAEFLRWMLSDGAGALLLSNQPRPGSFRIDWIEIVSYSSDYDLCMSCGTTNPPRWTPGYTNGHTASVASWQDYATYGEAEKAGALLIRQDLRLLENIVKVGVDGFLRLIQRGRLRVEDIDFLLCHYSSHYFKSKIVELLKMAGAMVPEERWFTNLYDKGNTGCAAIFIMLDELCTSGRAKPGDTIVCVVPESGRFTAAYMKLTVV